MRGMDKEDVVHIYNEISFSHCRRKWQPTPVFCLERRVWWAIVHGVTRVRYDLATKPNRYSSMKTNNIGSLVETLDLKTVIQSKVNQKQKKHIVYINEYMWNPKKLVQMILIAKLKQRHRISIKVSIPGESGEDGMNWDIGIDIYALLCIQQTTNENLLYSTGNSTQ